VSFSVAIRHQLPYFLKDLVESCWHLCAGVRRKFANVNANGRFRKRVNGLKMAEF